MSLLDFLIDLEDKEIKFYLKSYHYFPLETRYSFRVIVEGCSFNPVHALAVENRERK